MRGPVAGEKGERAVKAAGGATVRGGATDGYDEVAPAPNDGEGRAAGDGGRFSLRGGGAPARRGEDVAAACMCERTDGRGEPNRPPEGAATAAARAGACCLGAGDERTAAAAEGASGRAGESRTEARSVT